MKTRSSFINVFDTDEYVQFKKRMNPGEYIRLYRENHDMTQIDLGEKLGLARSYICDLEKGCRSISKGIAKKLNRLLGIPLENLL